MQAIETTASFNGKGELHIDNLPPLKNQKVKLLILLEETEQEEWHRLSAKGLSEAYSTEEPTYTPDMLKEPNAGYHK